MCHAWGITWARVSDVNPEGKNPRTHEQDESGTQTPQSLQDFDKFKFFQEDKRLPHENTLKIIIIT